MALRNLRNVAIVMLLALFVAFAPHGGNVADTVLTAITMGFLAGISWTVYVLSRENQLTLATLSDGRRAVLYGAFGMIALLIAGSDELFSSGGGTLAWILLFAGSIAAIYLIWKEANTYS
jgi:Sec-independent protein secretion pathway component TatC